MSLLVLAVLLPLLLGTGLCFCLGRNPSLTGRRLTALAAGLVTAASFACLASLAPAVLDGQTLLVQYAWVPERFSWGS